MTYKVGDIVLWFAGDEVISQGIVVNTDEWVTKVRLCSQMSNSDPMDIDFSTKTNNEFGCFVEKDVAHYRIKKISEDENEAFIKERIEQIKSIINQKFNETTMKLNKVLEIAEFELNKLNIESQVLSFEDDNLEFRASVKGLVIQYFINNKERFPITEICMICGN